MYQIFITHNRIWSIREAICFSTVMLFALALGMYLKQKKKVTMCQVISGLLALLFLGIVFGSTVFTRNPGTRKYELELFWSWKVIFGIGPVGKFPSENPGLLLQENVLNMFLLMPFGMLLPFILKRRIAACSRLSDAFYHVTDKPSLELVVTTFNLNAGHNTELMSQCRILREYSIYVSKVRALTEQMPVDAAVQKAVAEWSR